MHTPGIGPVMAARLIARTRHIDRFATAAAYANYCGTAPIEIASAHKARHRLSRHGDRQLNCALHTIAVIQIRMPDCPGRAYYDRKIAEGKTAKEAKRCLKRQLTDHVWRIMVADERRCSRVADPSGHAGATHKSSAAGPTPTADSSDKSLPGHYPDPPPTSLRPTPLDRYRGTPCCVESGCLVSGDAPRLDWGLQARRPFNRGTRIWGLHWCRAHSCWPGVACGRCGVRWGFRCVVGRGAARRSGGAGDVARSGRRGASGVCGH
jgi:hypothetical protein